MVRYGIRTVAEFVESQDLLEAIRDMGINFAQGFHLGVPEPSMP
jgi:EAL domain-containing protein (putative c-di-GMP-specific phosphodiesterase class I)